VGLRRYKIGIFIIYIIKMSTEYVDITLFFNDQKICKKRNCLSYDIYEIISSIIINKKKWFIFEKEEISGHLAKMLVGESYRAAWNNITQNYILITKINMSSTDTAIFICPEAHKKYTMLALPPSPPPELEEEQKEYTVFCTKKISSFLEWVIKTFIVNFNPEKN